jgi:hypothetical protein
MSAVILAELPHDELSERALLAAAMLDPGAAAVVRELRVDDWYSPRMR